MGNLLSFFLRLCVTHVLQLLCSKFSALIIHAYSIVNFLKTIMAISHMQFEVFCNCGLPSLYSEKMICVHIMVMWFNIFCKKRSQTCTGRNRGFHTYCFI